ncbi:hypothetical protein H8B02_46910 [Bradyrhizobium sp. Pear77]|uniref:hypothetical protein n=1 Tax=Bradyrhizobium altum TaxID=1571202 RepID=UPI001E62F686|nr:hypothetical protein [Bradyrhizobium altum]MCC8960663.1 hypothetical protein [Bradyrhizobium altum]
MRDAELPRQGGFACRRCRLHSDRSDRQAAIGREGAARHEGGVLQEWDTPEERLAGTTEILRQLANLAESKKAA